MTDWPYIIPLTYRDPLEAFAAFAGDTISVFLDSAAEAGGRGRYAYIATDPYRVITAAESGDPFADLEGALRSVRIRNDPRIPPFQGGAAGFLGYELGRHLEQLPDPKGGLDIPDMVLGLFDTVAAFDTLTGKAWVIAQDIADDRPAKADRAKAEAQAAFEKAVVDAKRDKEVGILSAQKLAEQQVLDAQAAAKRVEFAAEADKNRNVLAAQGEQEAALLRAQAIKALGEAEAEATRLKLSAYAAEGADAFVKIEVSKSMSEAFKNIDGYLPQDMTVNLLSDSFLRAVEAVVGGKSTTPMQP